MRPLNEALLVIDVQNDFCPGGALAVPGGDEIISGLDALMDEFSCVVFTQDWHPVDHASFAVNQQDHQPYDVIEMPYGSQVLWPRHCVQGTKGAEFHSKLRTEPAQLIVRKGFRKAIDSYSAFFENDRVTSTGLDGWLKSRRISKLTLAGLATDFCVSYSALDAVGLGFDVTVREDLSRAIDLQGSLAAQRDAMLSAGILLL